MKVYVVDFINVNFDTKINEITELNPDIVLGIQTTEQYPEWTFKDLIDKLQPYLEQNKNCKFIILNIWTPETIVRPNTTFVNTSGSIIMSNMYRKSQEPFAKNYNPASTSKLYTCYNNNPVPARAQLVDLLVKENLLQDGMVTFHYPEKVLYKWQYHDGSKLLDENDYQLKMGSRDTAYYAHDIPKSYCTGFIDIVCETEARPNYENECYFLSEKTYKPIFVGKPFIALQAKGFHKRYLRDFYGLKLYDELFDYSFDDEELLDNRIQGIIENIKRLKNLCNTPEQKQCYYDLVKAKIDYNKARIIELSDDPNFIIPKMLTDIIENKDVQVFGDINKIPLLHVMKDKGWIKNEEIYNRIGL